VIPSEFCTSFESPNRFSLSQENLKHLRAFGLHLLLLKLASRRLGVARECSLFVVHPGSFVLPCPWWRILSEHQSSFLGVGRGKEALGDSPPFVGSSTET
jgi:hypothetical protein